MAIEEVSQFKTLISSGFFSSEDDRTTRIGLYASSSSTESLSGHLVLLSSCFEALNSNFGKLIECESVSVVLLWESVEERQALPRVQRGRDGNAIAQYLAMTTIATFFSSVTATTLQISSAAGNNATVNAFWYSSLILSVFSAVYNLLGLTWYQSAM